jgi:hypothetical protein
MDNIIDGYKPESIFEHIPRDWFLKQTLEEDYIDSGSCYEYYYALGEYYKPKSILEIGVLFGYSAAALILGAKQNIKLFDGYDMDYYFRDNFKRNALDNHTEFYEGEIEYPNWSSNKIAYVKLYELLQEKIPDHDIEVNIMTKNSQLVEYLPKHYEMVHIDGSHLGEHKLYDLKLTLGRSDVVIVDDYDFIPAIKEVTDEFVEKYKKYILNTNYIKSFRGTLVIEYKNAY